jgi:DNA-binding beta-propeller fold protein YncE
MNTKKYFLRFIILLLIPGGGSGFHCASPVSNDLIQKNVLTLTAQISLPNVSGRIDHLAYDSINHLAFVAALGNNTVEVVNIDKKQVIHTIKGLHEPQGVAYIPSLQKLVVANGDNGACMFFDTTNYALLSAINLKNDADNIRYDAETNLLYVGYGSGAIAIVDANTMKQVASIPLDGHPESFQLSKNQNRIYINVPDADEIEVADLSSHSVIAKWKNTNASSNFPMALDEENNRLFVGCRSPATLRMINTQTGKDIQSVACTGDADDVFYYSIDGLVFVSGGKGFIDVFKATDELQRINHIETSSGARTSLMLRSEKQLLLAVPASAGNPAALWIYTFN